MTTVYDTIMRDDNANIFSIEEACNLIDSENCYLLAGVGSTWSGKGSIYIAGESLEEAVNQLIEGCTDIKIEADDDNYFITAYHHDGQYHVQAIRIPSIAYDEYQSWLEGYPSIFARLETEKEFWEEILKLI